MGVADARAPQPRGGGGGRIHAVGDCLRRIDGITVCAAIPRPCRHARRRQLVHMKEGGGGDGGGVVIGGGGGGGHGGGEQL